MMRHAAFACLFALSACVSRPAPVATVAPPPAPPPVAVAPLPPGATPGMRIPALLADGSYATPNRGLPPEAALWHLRAGLNVAALACRGPGEAATVARYNALLRTRAAALEATRSGYERLYRAGGGDWQDRWDDAMTRLYNYFSQTPARPGFCAAADRLLVEMETVPDAALPGYAVARLPELDRPFTDFYRAYDAWRMRRPPAPMAVVAGGPPRLRVDPAVLRMP